jgi:uncharacterized protein YidB (DUF937 family)
MHMKKLIATISIIAALGVGAFALNTALPAGAIGIAAAPALDPSSQCNGPRGTFKGVLDKLVADGTISQEQEDAIVQAMQDAVTANRSAPGERRAGPRLRVLEGMIQVSAGKIGVSVDDLTAALKSGQSVADVANAHSVNPSDVVTAIVDAGAAKIDQGVSGGMLTQQMADRLEQRLPEIADKFVNHTGSC